MGGIVYILRGTAGAGKTTLAKSLSPVETHASADHYFTQPDGTYRFDPSKLDAAHKACLQKLSALVETKTPVIVVDNTHSRRSEMTAAWNLTSDAGYEVRELALLPPLGAAAFDAYVDRCTERGAHGVPRETVRRMALRLTGIGSSNE